LTALINGLQYSSIGFFLDEQKICFSARTVDFFHKGKSIKPSNKVISTYCIILISLRLLLKVFAVFVLLFESTFKCNTHIYNFDLLLILLYTYLSLIYTFLLCFIIFFNSNIVDEEMNETKNKKKKSEPSLVASRY
jgi:hypothetical protein